MRRVEDEWDRDPELNDPEDLLHVTYDAEKITTEMMLQLIEKQGFEAEVRGD